LCTVVAPAFSAGSPFFAQGVASAAGLALVVGVLPHRRGAHRLCLLGLTGFITLSLATWMLCPSALLPPQLETGQAALGGLGWLLFALSLKAAHMQAAPSRISVIESAQLRPLPRWGGMGLFAGVVAAGLIPLFMVWAIASQPESGLGHVVACAVGLCAFALAPNAAALAHRASPVVPAGQRGVRIAVWLIATTLLLALGVILKVR
jgi:hypothetical protein